jgi:hypothetical protein
MARIQEEVIVITVSKLHKTTPEGTETDSEIVSEDSLLALTSVAEELLGNGVVVEVSKA